MDTLKKLGIIKDTFPRQRTTSYDDLVVELMLYNSFKTYIPPEPSAPEPYSDESKAVALYEPPEKREENVVATIPECSPPDKERGKNPVFLEVMELRRQRWYLSQEKKRLLESDRRLRFMVEGDKSLKAITSGPLAIEDSDAKAGPSNAKQEDSKKKDMIVKATRQESQEEWLNLEGFPDEQQQHEGWRSANRDELWNGGSYPSDWFQEGDPWNQAQMEWHSQDEPPQEYHSQDESWSQVSYSDCPPQQGDSWDSGMGFGNYSYQEEVPYDTVWSSVPMFHGRGSQRFPSQYQRGFPNSRPMPRPTYPQYNMGNSQPQEEGFKRPERPTPKRGRGRGRKGHRRGSKKLKVTFADAQENA